MNERKMNYRPIDYRLLPADTELGENPRSLIDLLRDAPIIFTGGARETRAVPAPGDLVRYQTTEKINPDVVEILKELGCPNGDINGTYLVIVRQFHEPYMDSKMIHLGIKKII